MWTWGIIFLHPHCSYGGRRFICGISEVLCSEVRGRFPQGHPDLWWLRESKRKCPAQSWVHVRQLVFSLQFSSYPRHRESEFGWGFEHADRKVSRGRRG